MTPIQVTLPKNDTYNGETIAIDLESISLGDHLMLANSVQQTHVTKAKMQETIDERLTTATANQKRDLKGDRTFQNEILVLRNVMLGEDGEVATVEAGSTQEEVDKAIETQVKLKRTEWETETHAPVVTERDTLKNDNSSLRTRNLHLKLQESARLAHVKEEKFDKLPSAPLSAIAVIAQTQGRFAHNKEDNDWRLMEADGTDFVEVDGKRVGTDGIFDEMKLDDKIAAEWFDDDRPGSTDVGDPTTSTSTTKRKDGKEETLEERSTRLHKDSKIF